MTEFRAICDRCRRPCSVCFCAHIPVLSSRTRVVFLQHPRERRVAISTCRMAHLSLPGSELHHGVLFDGNNTLESLVEAGRNGQAAVLFPGEGALDPVALPAGQLRTLVVVDGTWSQAKKLIARNPLLSSLPRLGLAPSRPSNYRIRKEPSEECVSTIEAVVEVLGLLEGEPERFRAALAAFDHMIDTQIACAKARVGPPRKKRKRQPSAGGTGVPRMLNVDPAHLVLLAAEADASRDEKGLLQPASLLHLLALRPSTGETFEARVRPRRPLGREVPSQIEIPAARLEAGEALPDALRRFADFLAADDVLLGWGRFAYDLWRAESGLADRAFIDLRPLAARALRRTTGGVERAAESLSIACTRGQTLPLDISEGGQTLPLDISAPVSDPATPCLEGRGGRRLLALAAVLAGLEARWAGQAP